MSTTTGKGQYWPIREQENQTLGTRKEPKRPLSPALCLSNSSGDGEVTSKAVNPFSIWASDHQDVPPYVGVNLLLPGPASSAPGPRRTDQILLPEVNSHPLSQRLLRSRLTSRLPLVDPLTSPGLPPPRLPSLCPGLPQGAPEPNPHCQVHTP